MRTKPVRNPAYLRWVRSLPCSVCRTTWQIDAAHTGPHGVGQKSSDLSAIPLCAKHHRTGDDSYHKLGPRRFAEVHGVSIREIVTRLSAKSRIRVESGSFIARLGGQEYELGSTKAGLAWALGRVSDLRRQIETDAA